MLVLDERLSVRITVVKIIIGWLIVLLVVRSPAIVSECLKVGALKVLLYI